MKTENIACWMFLKWLSQMTAILDKPIAKSVYNIVNRIAIEYSQVETKFYFRIIINFLRKKILIGIYLSVSNKLRKF